jgi:hypothetical protein
MQLGSVCSITKAAKQKGIKDFFELDDLEFNPTASETYLQDYNLK